MPMKKPKITSKIKKTYNIFSSLYSLSPSLFSYKQLKTHLRDFSSTTGDLLGAEDLTAVESASVFLYDLFSSSPEWCKSHGEAIRKTFGPYPASVAMKVCDIAKSITLCVSTNEESNSGSDSSINTGDTTGTSEKGDYLKEEFGAKLSGFKFNTNLMGGAMVSVSVATIEDSLSEDEEEEVKSKNDVISHTLLSGLNKSQQNKTTNNQSIKNKKSKEIKNNISPPSKFGVQWLQDQCKRCGSELPWQQLYDQLFELLLSEIDATTLEVQVSL